MDGWTIQEAALEFHDFLIPPFNHSTIPPEYHLRMASETARWLIYCQISADKAYYMRRCCLHNNNNDI